MHAITRPGRERGFTLVELIMTMVLLGILGTVGANMISDSFTTTTMVNAGQASAAQARYALERLAREIREVKYVNAGSSSGSYAIDTASWSPTHLAFTRTIAGADVTVTIDSSGGSLRLGYSSPAVTSTLAGNVGSFALSYLDLSGNATTDTSNSANGIRFVLINLTLTDPVSGQSLSERTRVSLRNGG